MLTNLKKPYFVFIPFLILFLQNFIIFYNHFFNKIGFPWDFDKSYFVTPAFWTVAISKGIFPQWVPFQSMGYPLFMKANSAFHYPFYWVFPLFSIPYTLQMAVYFQIFHIFLGSVGMFFFLLCICKSPKYAIIGAVAFQFFGGFYGNSSHADIVRGISLLPWLFYVLTLNLDKPSITKKTLFVPIIIFFIATGAYPGIFIASVFIMAAFILAQTFNLFTNGFGKTKSLKIGSSLFGLLFLGLLLSMVHLGVFIDSGDELSRSVDRSELKYNVLGIEEFPGFFMSNSPIPAGITMSSSFLTLPILIFASFIPWSFIKKYWIFFMVFSIGILMAIGNQTPFWNFITGIVPLLDLSRFLISDYRVFIALPCILFGVLGIKAIIERQLPLRSYLYRLPFVFGWFITGLFILHDNSSRASQLYFNQASLDFQTSLAIIIFVSTLIIIFLHLKLKLQPTNFLTGSVLILIIFGSLIVIDGGRVISDMETWKRGEYDERYVKFNVPLEKNGKLRTYDIFENIPDTRPERKITINLNQLSWRGVLTGEYMMQDSGKYTALKSRTIVESNDIYQNYMFMKWTPILLDSPNLDGNKILIDEQIFSNIENMQPNSVIQTHYGINDIRYTVSLTEPKLMVENEMYFPGWTATLVYPGKEVPLEAIEVNEVFRAWALPAGEYQMEASFEFPNYSTYQIISLGSFIIWIVIVIVYLIKTRRRNGIRTMPQNLG